MIESGEQSGASRTAAPSSGSTAAGASTGQSSTGQSSTGQSSTGQSSTGQSSTGQSGTGPADTASWLAAWQPEDAPLLAARQRAREVGVGAVDEVTGATLRLLAAASGARHVVELGTGAGVSTLWLLRGLHPDGVLTSIDPEPEHQRLAKMGLREAGTPSGRVRLIAGRALDVLPRLSDGAYDLVLCDGLAVEAVDYLPAALRLLRTGGLVVFAGALAGGRVADSSARDPETLAARELARVVRDEPRLVPAMLPIGPGLLVGVKVDAPPL